MDQILEFSLCSDVHGNCSKLSVPKSSITGVGNSTISQKRSFILVGEINSKYFVNTPYATVVQMVYGNDITPVPEAAS